MTLSVVDLKPIEGILLRDKVMHILAYGLLMGWFAQIYRHFLARLCLALALVSMGIFVEYLQSWVSYRQFDTVDMLANTAGILLAWALSYTWLGRLFVSFERIVPR